MKKILLLENQTNRQQNKSIDLDKFSQCSNILGDKKCNDLLKKFLEDNRTFDDYDVIVIHENIYFEDERKMLFQVLESYCKSKYLVKFSGNNSQPFFNKNTLILSAKTLYENIEIYLDENEKKQADIFMLAYGQKWKLNILLNTLQNINLFIENNRDDDIDFDDFEDDCNLLELKKVINKEDYDSIFKDLDFDDEIEIEEINLIAKNLKNLIYREANE